MNSVTYKNVFHVVGKNIKYYRGRYAIRHGSTLSQEKLSEMVGTSPDTINNIECNNPRYGVNIRTLCDIAYILEVPVSKFLEVDVYDEEFENVDIDSSNIYSVIGKNIKYYRFDYIERHECDLSQETLAKMAGVSRNTIANLESKDPIAGITLKTLCKIAVVLEVPVHKLMEEPLLK